MAINTTTDSFYYILELSKYRSEFGQGGVQGMDGNPHRHRQEMFMSLMSEEPIQKLANITQEQ